MEKQLVNLQTELYRFAMSLTRDPQKASDLSQETYLKALSSKHLYKDDKNLRAWLYKIMQNTFINGYRKAQKDYVIRDNSHDSFLLDKTISQLPINPDSIIIEKEIQEQILTLSDKLRDPFLMYFNGYKYKEIAEKLNIGIGTIKSRIFFARQKLIETVEQY